MLRRSILCFLLFFLLIFSVHAAPEQVIANSADWRDVYSTVVYGKLFGLQTSFLVGQQHSMILLYSIPKTKSLLIVSSNKNPFAIAYKSIFVSQGYNSVEELVSSDINLDLAKKLPQITNFIIVDDSYGYNAISAAPYAQVSKSYVLFADKRNIGQIATFLQSRKVDKIILFGTVDREVRDRLAAFNPEIIDEGDRYLNDIEIVKRYMTLKRMNQVILTNGEFIEDQIMSGSEPVIFIGRDNVPDDIQNYVKSNDIQVGVLIGNELVGTATFVRRQLGISVFVKFAQGARIPQGQIANVEDLDRFPIPRYALSLSIFSIKYNQISNTIELTYHNDVDQATYFKGTITLASAEGTQTIGDIEPIFIDGQEYRTVVYPVEAMTGNITATIFTIFGESKKNFEYSLRQTLSVETVTIRDDAQIVVKSLTYDKARGLFRIEVVNTGKVDAYVTLEILNLLVNNIATNFGSKTEELVPAGQTKIILIKIDPPLTDADIEANPTVTVTGRYGSREHLLIKVIPPTEFELKLKGPDYVFYILLTVAIVLIILIIITFIKRRKKKTEED